MNNPVYSQFMMHGQKNIKEVNLLAELNNLTLLTVARFNEQTLNSHNTIDFSSD